MSENKLQVLKNSLWNQIEDHLNYWYYKPDLDALSIALATYVSHVELQDKAVWLFVIGPSGSGKTEIACSALDCLPCTTTISDISANSFVSGLASKKGGSSLLLNLTKLGKDPGHTQGVLVFKDFTSIISKRPEIKAEIMSQLRQIWDGHFNNIKGTKTTEWKGKVTIIAAVTPAIERAWAIQRELGERFVQVRWPREDGIETALASAKHQQYDIVPKFQAMVRKLVDMPSLMDIKVAVPDPVEFAYLAEMAAMLRGTVIRDTIGARTIIDVPQYEAPTRLMKSMIQIAIAHARLFRREECNERDIRLAKRIAFDSIPLTRLKIIDAMLEESTDKSDIVKRTGMQHATIDWVCDELSALKVLVESNVGLETFYSFAPGFKKLRSKIVDSGNIIPFPLAKENSL
jgi:hypothetical protein